MVITQLLGGMGNQMFRYAIGRHLALRCDSTLKVDTHLLLDHSGKHAQNRDYALDAFRLDVEQATRREVRKFSPHASGLLGKVVFRMKRAFSGLPTNLIEER